MYVGLLFLTLCWRAEANFYEDHYAEIKKAFQAEANSQKLSWMVGINDRFRGMSLADMKAFLGVSKDTFEDSNFTMETIDDLSAETLPEKLDARTKWPKCAELISIIKDQSNCGSCWAVSAASVMSDRTCIGSNGRTVKFLSDEELLSCCKNCGNGHEHTARAKPNRHCFSCNGGNPLTAMNYWKRTGVPTGGLYGSKTGCKPYSIPPNNEKEAKTPACTNKCIEEYPVDLAKDRNKGFITLHGVCNVVKPSGDNVHGKTVFTGQRPETIGNKGLIIILDGHQPIRIKHATKNCKRAYRVAGNERAMMKQLYQNGPIVGIFDVYTDFYYYKSGVYQHKKGDGTFVGAHAVRIIGWGKQGGDKYWLAANSWGTDWGENGYFKIKRGKNECKIESYPIAGDAKV